MAASRRPAGRASVPQTHLTTGLAGADRGCSIPSVPLRPWTFALLAAALLAPAAHAQQGQTRWRAESATQRVFTAGAWTPGGVRMLEECRGSAYLPAELGLTVAAPGKGGPGEGPLRLRAGDQSFEGAATRLDVPGTDAAWR